MQMGQSYRVQRGDFGPVSHMIADLLCRLEDGFCDRDKYRVRTAPLQHFLDSTGHIDFKFA
jgi:hypothetical protein